MQPFCRLLRGACLACGLSAGAFAADAPRVEGLAHSAADQVSCYAGVVGDAVVSHPRVHFLDAAGGTRFGDFDMYGGRAGGVVGCDYRASAGWFAGPQAMVGFGRQRGAIGTLIKGELAAEAALRIRLGTMMSPTIAVYVAAGPVGARWRVTNDAGQHDSGILVGGQVALGTEYFFTPSWKIGTEYAYSQFSERSSRYAAGTRTLIRSEPPEHIARAILSHVFAAEPPAYVVPARPAAERLSCYAGVLAEGARSRPRAYVVTVADETGFGSFDLHGGRGGGIAGCDYRFASGWFVGAQASAAFGRARGRLAGPLTGELTTESALRGRLGIAVAPDTVVYVAGGPIAGSWGMTNDSGQRDSKVLLGGQVALGLEYALTPNWRIGGEYGYSYYDYESSNFSAGRVAYIKSDPAGHLARVLLSYAF